MKNNKAPSCDNISTELIKNVRPALIEYIHKIIHMILESNTMPNERYIGIICPIHKKGDILEYTNYKGISLYLIG